MAAEAKVQVAYRAADQDVVEWMEVVVRQAIEEDHSARSPMCIATHMEYAKIPAPENVPYVGGKPALNS